MTIRALLFSIVGILGVLVTGFSGTAAYQSWARYRLNSAFLEADRAAELLLKGAADLAIERGLCNAPLHAPDPLAAPYRDEVTHVRAGGDQALRDGLEQLRR